MHVHVPGRTLIAVLGMLAAAAMATSNVAGEERPQHCQQQVASDDKPFPLLGHIPYIGRLFVGNGEAGRCPDAERIGVDFRFVDGQMLELNGPVGSTNNGQFFPIPNGETVFSWHAGETCNQRACTISTSKCGAISEASSRDGQCCAGKLCAVGCGAEAACGDNKGAATCCAVKCGTAACCQQLVAKASSGTCPVKAHWEELTELVAENAAMEATLKAQEELLEARSEMFESLAEALIEKAKLEAKLEMVEHRDALLKEMVALHAENARLKAQTELAQQKEELLQTQLATVLENERLKQRVAELERQQGGDGESTLTAKRASKMKKTR